MTQEPGAVPAVGTRPQRRRLRYELLGCGLHGHRLVGTDAAAVRPGDALLVREGTEGLRWHRCLRCDAILERHHSLSVNAMLALVVTAMIAFVQANIWPIVTLGLNGQLISTTLWGCIVMMWRDHAQVVAVLAALTLFFFPLIKMSLFAWVFWFARRGERGPGFRGAMIALHYLRPWTMSEVFVLGAMVAIVKARVYFQVVPDPGIFAYGALMLLITVFGTVDLRQLWDVTQERRR